MVHTPYHQRALGAKMAAVAAAATGAPIPESKEDGKDEIWWTELELRRLRNVVGVMLRSKRYETHSRDRAELRKYLDAMRRKALRVLHRAEQVSEDSSAFWPGLDAAETDPVARAEDYVRTIERYETEFASAPPLDHDDADAEDEWAKYDEALRVEQERARADDCDRDELMAGADVAAMAKSELRQRKPGNLTKADEEFLAKHQPVQEQLTATLADAVGQLKNSVIQTGEQLRRDEKVVDETENAIDKNLNGIKKQRGDLAKLERTSSLSWWMLIILAVIGIGVFAFVLIVLSAPI